MKILSNLLGANITDPIEAIGNAIDKVTTTDEERLQAQAVLERLRQKPGALQVELNKVEASHRSVFVAGWRPFIGWVCGMGLAFVFLVNPILQWATGDKGPDLPFEAMSELILALLGMGALRSAEKITGRAK